MTKLDIKDLRFLVLEGGGARGAAYLGAIQALEELLETGVGTTTELAMKPNGSGPIDRKSAGKNALLDYISTADKQLKIRGVAGSSAGAITSYALALGLNAHQIEQDVMAFEFKHFLSKEQEIPGKYRMIDAEGKLMIGEDVKRNKQKIVGLENTPFQFDLTSNETVVQPSLSKKNRRTSISALIVKVILDGTLTNLERIINWFRVSLPFWRTNLIQNHNQRMTNELIQGFSTSALAMNAPSITEILLGTFGIRLPFKLSYENITNALFDTGMFSGFKVREFFYDLTLYAVTRDTHFQRSIIKAIDEGRIPELKEKLTANDLNLPGFKIGERSATVIPDKLIPLFNYLQTISFQQFYEITGLHFGVCVSNLTTNLPLYFSHRWTPDFPVQEAVGASMTIPPAIKPIYNKSNVFGLKEDKTVRVSVSGDQKSNLTHMFVDANGNFSAADYYRYDYVVKKALQEILFEKNKVWISTNNVNDITTFLPLMREIVIGEYDKTTRRYKTTENRSYTVVVGSITYRFNQDLIRFYYNAAYLGLYVDGGYRNNIPYNFFRESLSGTSQELKEVLALKLDGNFPNLLTSQLIAGLTGFGPLEETIPRLNGDLKKRMGSKVPKQVQYLVDLMAPLIESYEKGSPTEFRTPNTSPVDIKLNRQQLLNRAKKILVDFYSNQIKDDTKQQLSGNDPAVIKMLEALLKTYNAELITKPWEKRVGLSLPATDGYAYGSEMGQIRFMSDHNSIIPLYSCGVDTFDFDLKKVAILAKLSQETSKQSVLNYFGATIND